MILPISKSTMCSYLLAINKLDLAGHLWVAKIEEIIMNLLNESIIEYDEYQKQEFEINVKFMAKAMLEIIGVGLKEEYKDSNDYHFDVEEECRLFFLPTGIRKAVASKTFNKEDDKFHKMFDEAVWLNNNLSLWERKKGMKL